MSWYVYLAIAYLGVVNIASFFLYLSEGRKPTSRLAAVALILLPIVGGSFGAVLANYFSDVEHKELRRWLAKFLGFLPPIMLIIHSFIAAFMIGVEKCLSFVWESAYAHAGVIGHALVVINIITFFLIIIRKSAYYIAPNGKYLIPDLILIPIIILGGSAGAVIAKIIFNFKEDWSCNSTKGLQNFVYNGGIFIILAIHIVLYIYFFLIR